MNRLPVRVGWDEGLRAMLEWWMLDGGEWVVGRAGLGRLAVARPSSSSLLSCCCLTGLRMGVILPGGERDGRKSSTVKRKNNPPSEEKTSRL